MNGWVKLYRKFQKWGWRDSPKHVSIFLDLILEANHKDNFYRGELVKKGSLTTSYKSIAERTGTSVQQVRTVLTHLESTHEITRSTNSKRTMISITNWDDYQHEQHGNQQSTNNQLTTNKNEKNEKKEIIEYLNYKTGKNYRTNTTKTLSLINARLNEKFTLNDFKAVIDVKTEQWLNTDNEKYLRPETLFGNKFEGYLNEKATISNDELLKRLEEI